MDKHLSASDQIDQKLIQLGDWRAQTLSHLRGLIKAAVPDVIEEWKWVDTPVWSHQGILCTGETYKGKVKLTFPKGASLPDPMGLFNSSLEGKVRRAIDVSEGVLPDAEAFKALIRAAADLNAASKKTSSTKAKQPVVK
ncbi:MAG TPA: DUF1801 domain-containing protein [Aquabacterium sp.]|nr:DUF1801 domain-containing protein [Aquabacterium sp.]